MWAFHDEKKDKLFVAFNDDAENWEQLTSLA